MMVIALLLQLPSLELVVKRNDNLHPRHTNGERQQFLVSNWPNLAIYYKKQYFTFPLLYEYPYNPYPTE